MNGAAVVPTMAQTVLVNERMKAIVSTASRIDLVAVNALLVARRANAGAGGFGVVSNELRVFSARVIGTMAEIETLIHLQVHRIANLTKLQRRAALWQRIQDADAVNRHQVQILALEAAAAESSWLRLRREMRAALSLCRYGMLLSSNGRIEATYGGAMLGQMRALVGDIEDIVGNVVQGLKQLHLALGDQE